MSLFAFHQSGFFAQLYYTVYDDARGSWQPDTQVPNVGIAESPSAVVWNGRLHVFHQGYDSNMLNPIGGTGALWFSYFDGANWQPDTQVPNVTVTESPSAVVYGDDLYVFHQGGSPGVPNGELWYSVYHPGSGWQPDTQLSNVGMSKSPSAVVYGTDLYVFHQGGYENGELWYSAYLSGSGWQPDTQLPNAGLSESPSAVVYGTDLYIFHQEYSQDGLLDYAVYRPGSGWQGSTIVQDDRDMARPNNSMAGSPSAIARNSDLFVFCSNVPIGSDFPFGFSRFDGANWDLDNPVPSVGGIQGSPTVISTG